MPTEGYSHDIARFGPYRETWRFHEDNREVVVGDVPDGSIVGKFVDIKPTTTSGITPGSAWKMPTEWSRKVLNFSISSSRSAIYDPRFGPIDIFLDNERWNGLVTSDNPLSYDRPVLEDRAIVAALKQLRGKGPDVLTVIGERHETLRLFTSTVGKVFETYRAFKRNNPGDWLKVLRHDVLPLHKMPSAWLQVQFGVRPLVNDLQNAMQFEENLRKGLAPMVSVKGKADSGGIVNPFEIPSDSGYLTMVGEDQGKVSSFVRLDYRKDDENLATLNALGITNPFIAGWELLPWSFVIDYMSNVGDVISSWGATLGWSFMSGSCSFTERYVRRGKARLAAGAGGYSADSVSGTCVRFLRKTYQSSPLPGLHFKDPASYVHAANLVSLATDKLIEGSFKKSPRG